MSKNVFHDHHTALNAEECSKLIRLLKWVNIACHQTEDEKACLDKILYKLRCRVKEEGASD